MKKNRFVGRCLTFFLLVLLPSGLIISCKEDEDDIVKGKTITEVIIENDRFSILEEVILHAKMGDALRTGDVTFFAPDNAAFGKANIFDSKGFIALPADSAKKFLQNHIIPKKRIEYAQFVAGKEKSLTGKEITFTKTDSVIIVNQNNIIVPNIGAANGVIHIIDSLIVK
ncbi:fasciclin domain-containing protein [Dyadobacter sp. CY326]|uniref:fasciclin domain-containing protein n=1 Tax=Dyadobacter sp. CY326 TaxID=2907300 RepID=UPI001F373F05|nr:fasciclin domain-containing protein [Dyadobacter sp. CY326]MCE7067842.1 fasciclin domain-containing protein [Dyadobacter sp. CY326]